MVQLLQKLSIRATNGPDKLLKVSICYTHTYTHTAAYNFIFCAFVQPSKLWPHKAT